MTRLRSKLVAVVYAILSTPLCLGGIVTSTSTDKSTQAITESNTHKITGGELIRSSNPDVTSTQNHLIFRFDTLEVDRDETLQFENSYKIDFSTVLNFVNPNNLASIKGKVDTTAFVGTDFYFISPKGITIGDNAWFNSKGNLYLSTATGLTIGTTTLRYASWPFLSEPELVGEISLDLNNPKSGYIDITDLYPVNDKLFSRNNNVFLSSPSIHISDSVIKTEDTNLYLTTTAGTNNFDGLSTTKGTECLNCITFSNRSEIIAKGGSLNISTQDFLTENGENWINFTKIKKEDGGINFEVSGEIYLSGPTYILGTSNVPDPNPGRLINIYKFRDLRILGGSLVKTQASSSTDFSNPTFPGIEIASSSGDIIIGSNDDTSFVDASSSGGKGLGGTISITANKLIIMKGGTISSASSGDAAFIDENISEEEIGAAGEIHISVKQLSVSGGVITTQNSGNTEAGRIVIEASNMVQVNGQTSKISSSTLGESTGGNIEISSPNLVIEDGAKIVANAGPDEEDISQDNTAGIKKSGDIVIDGRNIAISGAGTTVNVSTRGADSGNISLNTSGILLIGNEATVSTSVSDQDGDGGNINITGTSENALLVLSPPTDVETPTGSSEGPTTKIVAGTEEGRGGLVQFNNISIAGLRSRDSGIEISAEAGDPRGIPGEIRFKNASVDAVPGTEELPEDIFDTSALASKRCQDAPGGRSNFVINDKQGVRSQPGDLLSTENYNPARTSRIGPKNTRVALERAKFAREPVFFTCQNQLK